MPTFSGKGQCGYYLDDRVRLDFLADYSTERTFGLWSKIQSFLLLRQIIKARQPDVVVSFLTRVNVATILATAGLRLRIVVSERNNPDQEELGFLVKILRRIVYRFADVVVVQTRYAARWIRNNCAAKRVEVIPNPIMTPLSKTDPIVDPEAWIAEGRRILLAVGRFVEQKNFECLIDAFGLLAKEFPKWDLVIAGEGPLRARMEHERKVLGLQGRIYFPGRVGNLGDWYCRSDVYVMSSLFEGFPNTLLESLAHGLPVVSFDCESGPRDMIVDGVNGILVPGGDGAAGLAKALRGLMTDNARRQEMGNAATAVKEEFSVESIDPRWQNALGFTPIPTKAISQ